VTAQVSEATASAAPTLDVAVYGIINAGKSSLINALAHRDLRETGPIGGTTGDVATKAWRELRAEVGPFSLRLIDTPGIEEVAGHHRADLATGAAKAADLVLFVTAEDLTAAAIEAVHELNQAGKPLMVALNKSDLLSPDEQAEILASLCSKLDGIVAPDDVVAVAAAPIVREKVEGADGVWHIVTLRGAPEVSDLEDRLLAAISATAPELKALAEASRRVEGALAELPERQARRTRAERVADETAAALAVALAVNPIPAIDLLTGPSGLAILVRRVAHVYGVELDREAVKGLASDLFRGGRVALWGSLAGVGVGGALKFFPGLGHLAGALAQGTSAGLFGHVVGRALIDYFERGQEWGEGGLIALLDQIAAQTDRKALTRGLVARLREQLDRAKPPRWGWWKREAPSENDSKSQI
jgi:small GTP-binding protein